MKVDLVPGVTPVALGSVEQTAAELTRLITECRGTADDSRVRAAAREAAEIAHGASARLVAVLRHATADPALLLGVLAMTSTPVPRSGSLRDLIESSSDIREIVEGRTPKGYPVVFVERIVSAERLGASEPFDCQLQATVADPDHPRVAVFTLSSATGRGWLGLSTMFGRLVRSVDFHD